MSAAIQPSASNPDLKLHVLCNEYERHWAAERKAIAALDALPKGSRGYEHDKQWSLMDRHQSLMHGVARKIFKIKAKTSEGLRAKASVLRKEIDDYGSKDTDPETGFAYQFARNVEKALPGISTSDAELIARCSQFEAAERQIEGVATPESAAVIEFVPLDLSEFEMPNLSDWTKSMGDHYPVFHLAVGLAGKNKKELVDIFRKEPESVMKLGKSIYDTLDKYKAGVELLEAIQARIMIAAAVIAVGQ